MEKNIKDKIDDYLSDVDVDDDPNSEIMERMLDIIVDLEPEQVTEEQADMIMDIVEYFDDDDDQDDFDDDDLEEGAKLQRRDKMARRQRSRKYRKQKAKFKRIGRKYRRSARGKQMARRRKQKKRQGRTATGKRIRRFSDTKRKK